jgi:hypothetical protein
MQFENKRTSNQDQNVVAPPHNSADF